MRGGDQDELDQLIARADRSAYLDPLTGIANRARAAQELARGVELAERRRRPLSAVRVDVDLAGRAPEAADAVLQAVARTLATALRLPDLPARWAPAAFAVLLPDTPAEGARTAAERLAATGSAAAGSPVRATAITRERGEPAEALVSRIDAAGSPPPPPA